MTALRFTENALLLIGLLAVDVWIWSNAGNALYQGWENWVFDQETHHRAANIAQLLTEEQARISGKVQAWVESIEGAQRPTSAATTEVKVPEVIPPRATKDDGLVGRLTIPRLHLSGMVREGAGEETLSLALGHIPYTALPGQPGNVGVAGHRDQLFRGLRNIRRDDLIVFETLEGKYVYRVKSTSIVKPQDTSVLDAGRNSELTLVTCYPFYYVGSAPERFIVKALQMPPSSQTLAAKL